MNRRGHQTWSNYRVGLLRGRQGFGLKAWTGTGCPAWLALAKHRADVWSKVSEWGDLPRGRIT